MPLTDEGKLYLQEASTWSNSHGYSDGTFKLSEVRTIIEAKLLPSATGPANLAELVSQRRSLVLALEGTLSGDGYLEYHEKHTDIAFVTEAGEAALAEAIAREAEQPAADGDPA